MDNPLLVDPSKTKFVEAVEAANIDLYRTGMLSKRAGKAQMGPDITGTAFSQTVGGTDLSLTAGLNVSNTISIYQTFTPAANYPLNTVAARFKWVSATKPDNVVCKLYSTSATLPATVLATSTTVTASSITIPSTGFARISFTFPSPYTVLVGVQYWFGFEFTRAGSTGAQSVTMDSTDLGDSDVTTKVVVFGPILSRDLWYEANAGAVQGIYDYRFSRNCEAPNGLVIVVIDGGLYFADPSGNYLPKKYGGISPDPYPPLGSGTFAESYTTSTTAEKVYSFITEADGTMSNGDQGYVITP